MKITAIEELNPQTAPDAELSKTSVVAAPQAKGRKKNDWEEEGIINALRELKERRKIKHDPDRPKTTQNGNSTRPRLSRCHYMSSAQAESRRNSAASHAHSTTTHILAPSAMSSTDYLEPTALEQWYTAAWYRFGKGTRRIGNGGQWSGMRHHRLQVDVGRDSPGGAMHARVSFKDRERAVDASRSTDQNSNSTTPHVARAGAPRESAEWCACVARGAGVGVPAQPLRLVATTTQRAVRRQNPRRVRVRLPRAPHARLGGLRRSGIARRGRFAQGAAAQAARAKSVRPVRAHQARPPTS
ncbi:hypothetical protein FB451DRAFT_1437466 [Mycena latifolia]|nr:hypothetical protein FB451DRAFT_1437466 [Mycena latifolia]